MTFTIVGRCKRTGHLDEEIRRLADDPDQFTRMIRTETALWAKIIRDQGIKVD